MQNAFRTDLAAEAFERINTGSAALSGAAARQEELFGLPLFAVSITGEEAAEKIGKPLGQYYTLSLASPLTRAAPDFGAAAAAVAALIRRCGVPEEGGVLVAALGNPDITPDALGPLCASSVLVTRHLKAGGDPLWNDFASVSLLRTGVLGTVGVESGHRGGRAGRVGGLAPVPQHPGVRQRDFPRFRRLQRPAADRPGAARRAGDGDRRTDRDGRLARGRWPGRPLCHAARHRLGRARLRADHRLRHQPGAAPVADRRGYRRTDGRPVPQ